MDVALYRSTPKIILVYIFPEHKVKSQIFDDWSKFRSTSNR